MTTKAIFNIDKKLKERAIRKAKKEGTTFSTVLTFATKAYVDDRLDIDLFGAMIHTARQEIWHGKGVPQEEVFKRLGL